MFRATCTAVVLSSILTFPGGALAEDGVPACEPTPSTRPDPAARPVTIPAIREWRPSGARFDLAANTRVIYSEEALRSAAEILADDLMRVLGAPVAVGEGDAAGPGEVFLTLGECDPRLGREGYRLTIGDTFEIRAREAAGVFYGTQTLLQLLAQSRTVAGGEALDWPRYPERGLMIDAGRKYFTPEWIQDRIREMAYLKLNLFHLHFSENLGFRLESESHPEIVSADHLTKDEVRQIVAMAERHHITVVPEIGMPGHMGAALAPHPELQLTDLLGIPAPERLDVANPAAVTFARELIEEYLPLFPGRYWHTGADEYMPFYEYLRYPHLAEHARAQYGPDANGKDAVHGHVNWAAGIVRAAGKTTRAWNDDLDGGSAVTLDPDIVVEWWTNFSPLGDFFEIPSPQELLDRGHRILNAGWFPTYYVVGGAAGIHEDVPPRASMRDAYEIWEVHDFYGPLYSPDLLGRRLYFPPHRVDPDEPRNLGAKLQVWCDDPEAETESEIAAGIAPRLRVLAQKTWDSEALAPSYAEFQSIMEAVGTAP